MSAPIKPKNNRLVIFAGAGASARLGFPTTPQFILELSKQWSQLNTLLSTYRDYYSEVEGVPKQQVPVDSEYIRDWLVNIKRAANSIEIMSKTQPFDTNISATEHASQFLSIVLTNFDAIVRDSYGEIEPEKACNHYNPLFKSLHERGINFIPIFTTNYDLVFECMKDDERIDWYIETGMRSTGRRVILNTEKFNKLSPKRPQIVLFKLHGSTDWWQSNIGNRVERITIGYSAPKDYQDLLIYPTREKISEVGQEPFSFFYSKLNTYLLSKRTDLCIAIGYSFRDAFINEIFAKAINRGMRLLIYDVGMKIEQFVETFKQLEVDDNTLNESLRVESVDFGAWDNPNSVAKIEQSLNDEIGESIDSESE